MKRKHRTRLLLIAILVCVGLWLEFTGLLDAAALLEVARGYSGHWWLLLILVLAQALLFTFALAGSLFLWVIAPLYAPPLAAFLLAAGGTLGGIGAYFFSSYVTADWRHRIENSRTYRLLQTEENFFTLFAMRVFPGFPHALVNYSAGILSARLSHFVLAAALGIFIKSYIYARVIYPASSALSLEVLLDFSILAPLLALSATSAVIVLMSHLRSR